MKSSIPRNRPIRSALITVVMGIAIAIEMHGGLSRMAVRPGTGLLAFTGLPAGGSLNWSKCWT